MRRTLLASRVIGCTNSPHPLFLIVGTIGRFRWRSVTHLFAPAIHLLFDNRWASPIALEKNDKSARKSNITGEEKSA